MPDIKSLLCYKGVTAAFCSPDSPSWPRPTDLFFGAGTETGRATAQLRAGAGKWGTHAIRMRFSHSPQPIERP